MSRSLPARGGRLNATRLAPGSAGCPVLIADDVAEGRAVLAELLTELGFVVRTAVNGLDAVQQCQESAPRLALLDLRMPVMDGFEAARRLRAAHGAAIRIIVVSATVSEEARAQAVARGARMPS
jgi:CheY-like chemotaxis protein